MVSIKKRKEENILNDADNFPYITIDTSYPLSNIGIDGIVDEMLDQIKQNRNKLEFNTNFYLVFLKRVDIFLNMEKYSTEVKESIKQELNNIGLKVFSLIYCNNLELLDEESVSEYLDNINDYAYSSYNIFIVNLKKILVSFLKKEIILRKEEIHDYLSKQPNSMLNNNELNLFVSNSKLSKKQLEIFFIKVNLKIVVKYLIENPREYVINNLLNELLNDLPFVNKEFEKIKSLNFLDNIGFTQYKRILDNFLNDENAIFELKEEINI
jgi:hypothetical protein